ncbi:MAG: hypothetical protein J0I12_02175 [Candidatus Eremiobacteraeota bacterium]|nr:hypothetical protein [Candidatus Eremiobacteraeota bacterium]
MKRWMVCALLACGCMTPAQQQEAKRLDLEIAKARMELVELATAQKAIDHYQAELKTLTAEVDVLRTEVTQKELARGRKGKPPVFLR